MRDLIVALIVFGSLPVILVRPFVGILMWAWLSYMNPHRMTWDWAYNLPFAQMVALCLFVGMILSKDRKDFPLTSVALAWLAFVLWMNVTTLFALDFDNSAVEWNRTMKIQLLALVTVMLTRGQLRINWLVIAICASIGFFGVKGGIFTLVGGGTGRVFGPPDSFIADNNTIALAMVMVVPLIWYLYLQSDRWYLRYGLLGGVALVAIAILGTQSRGGFLAIGAMSFYLLMKSRRRVWLLLGLAIGAPIIWGFMPDEWQARMLGIQDFQEDGSAMGRINAWMFAVNLALDRPIVGGGFDTFWPHLFILYAPDPMDFHDAHSIYFEILAEHGFVGLGLFVILGILTYYSAGRTLRRVRRVEHQRPDLHWVVDLSSMLQVSIVAYAAGGAFLGLAYFDLYYHLVGLTVVLKRYVDEELPKEVATSTRTMSPPVTHSISPRT